VCHLGLNPKRRTGIENDVIFETTGRITAFSPAYSYFVYSPPPQFVLFEDEDVASSSRTKMSRPQGMSVPTLRCRQRHARPPSRLRTIAYRRN
jgi:hypothetical protein